MAVYGAEVYCWDTDDTAAFLKCQTQAWRTFLNVGGRSPLDALQPFLSLDCVTTQWRVSRLGLFLRLANSPAGSLQQLALIQLRALDDRWFKDVVADLRIITPRIHISTRSGRPGPFLAIGGLRSDAGEWLGAQRYQTFIDITGETLRAGPSNPLAKRHTHTTNEGIVQDSTAAIGSISALCEDCAESGVCSWI